MRYQIGIVLGTMSLIASMVHADRPSVFDGGWRISAGAVYDSGVKTKMRYAPRQTYTSPYSRTAGMTKEAAKNAGWGTQSGTRTSYKNGNSTAFIDTDDPGYAKDGKTFNYSFPAAVWDGNTAFEVGHAEYEEVEVEQGTAESMRSYDSDEKAMPGISVQLSRNLYHDDENRWGVEVAVGYQYARRNDVIKSVSNWIIGKATKYTGGYSSTYNANGELAEVLPGSRDGGTVQDLLWGSDDAIGGDMYAINPNDVTKNEWHNTPQTSSDYGSLSAHGDYEDQEIMLLLQPYYDVCDWFSINGTLGAVISRQSMEMSFAMYRNGLVEYSHSSDASQWDVYGVAGLGFMFYYSDFTLSCDFMARFLDRDMDIDDLYYHGTVERGDWFFRLGIGYEF